MLSELSQMRDINVFMFKRLKCRKYFELKTYIAVTIRYTIAVQLLYNRFCDRVHLN